MSEKLTYEYVISSKIDVYDALGINELASDSLIRKAYYKQALKYHPDKNPSDEAKAKFLFASQIYEFLSDEEAKGKYDKHLQRIQQSHERQKGLSEEMKRKRQRLRELEKEFADRNDDKKYVDALREEGMQQRLELERKMRQSRPGSKGILAEMRSVKVGISDKGMKLMDSTVLSKLFEIFGAVRSVQMSRGQGLVTFESLLAVERVLECENIKDVWQEKGYKLIGKLVTDIQWAWKRLDKNQLLAGIIEKEIIDPPTQDRQELTVLKLKQLEK